MKNALLYFLFASLLISCDKPKEVSSVNPVKWSNRTVNYALNDSMIHGSTYISVYSQIYSKTEHRTHDLTATISIRNINKRDSIFINHAEYFDTKGNSIRNYFDKTVFIAPMETIEIVIDETDKVGGTGANFIFDWQIDQSLNEPLIEGVMISTYGQQGLSFTTKGVRIE
jgi:hypothetical protein